MATNKYAKSRNAMIPTIRVSIQSPLHLLAKADVECGQNEEEDHGSDENDVGHYFSFGCSQKRE